MLTLAVPTLNRFDLLQLCVSSALAGTVRPDQVLVIDNSSGQCPEIAGAEIVPGRQPQSVAKAWNDAVRLVAGDLILSNDDIAFAPDTIACLLTIASEHPRAGIVSAIAGERFALFWLRYAAYLDMGGFDEGYSPTYFEDNHAARVLSLKGWEMPIAPCAVGHVRSATLAAYTAAQMAEHHEAFRRNRARYYDVWGGLPGEEVYTEPYGARHA